MRREHAVKMEEENRDVSKETADTSDIDISRENTEAPKAEEAVSAEETATSESYASAEAFYSEPEHSESSETPDYGTMPGSWASYEAEQRSNRSMENGVYPENGEKTNGSDYFGSYRPYNNGGYYGQDPWRGYPPMGGPQKPKKNNKRAILFGALGALALVLVISAAVGVFQLFNRIADNLGSTLPPSSEQGGESSGQQSNGSSQSSSSSTGAVLKSDKNHIYGEGFALTQTAAGDKYTEYTDVYGRAKDSVVYIKSSIGSGSGVIISKDTREGKLGYFIVTNNHVIDGASEITVTVSGGTEYKDVIFIGRDESTDLAVLKIEEKTELSVITLGRSDDLRTAEKVLVIGNPLGLLGSATEGIISGDNREVTIDGYKMNLLQTSAAVNPGNSGGGMFNMSGQLIGIVNAKYASEEVEGIGFAIPIDSAKPIIEDLVNYGYVKGRSNLGLKVSYGVKSYEPYYYWWVTEVKEGSDAAKAGIRVNDMILSIEANGSVFTQAEALSVYLSELNIGTEVTVTVRRYTSVRYYYTYEDKKITFKLTEYCGE